MTGVSSFAAAILIGGAFAGGVISLLCVLPRWRAASLLVRVGPYVRDVVSDADLPRGALPTAGALPASSRTVWAVIRDGFERMMGGERCCGDASLRRAWPWTPRHSGAGSSDGWSPASARAPLCWSCWP
ncbi:hypothetical protein [Microbacterium sp. Se63.02b]|uniref:hypothetical protein n=1 Tax=Microbacterium sp. Se63.02b TaxID=2709304 RepID=UPI0031F68105